MQVEITGMAEHAMQGKLKDELECNDDVHWCRHQGFGLPPHSDSHPTVRDKGRAVHGGPATLSSLNTFNVSVQIPITFKILEPGISLLRD